MAELFTEEVVPVRTLRDLFQPMGEEVMGTTSADNIIVGGNLVGGMIQGSSFKTGDIGARVELRPEWNPTIGIIAFNAAGSETFKVEVDGTNTGDITIGNYSGDQGVFWDNSAGSFNIKGTLTVGDIGGWTIMSGYIYSLASGTPTSSPSDGVVFASGNQGIIVYENTEKRAEFGYLSAGVYGWKVFDDNGTTVIAEVSDTQKMIAGWNFDNTYFYKLASGTPGSTPSDGLVLDGGATPTITAYENTEKRVELGYLSAGIYGLKVYADDGSTVMFEASDTQKVFDGQYLATASVTGTAIANATITATNITAATITATEIANATITATQIANATITGTQIAATTIQAGNIANGTITTTQISNTAGIVGGQIATGTITAGNITNLTITAAQIANLTITATQVANATLTNTQIAQNTITGGATGNIALTSITADNIAASTITASQIAANTITASQIAANTITASEIAAGTITATEMTIATLSAITANMGAITAGTIVLDTSGYIRGGQTAYNTGTGFFLGYDTDAYKFSIGDPSTNYQLWDGTNLILKAILKLLGTLELKSYTVATLPTVSGGDPASPGTMDQVVRGLNPQESEWFNLNNAKVSDNNYTDNGNIGSGWLDYEVKLVKGGSISGDNKSVETALEATDTYIVYGGASDLWGLGFTPEDINDSTFGFVFSVQQPTNDSSTLSAQANPGDTSITLADASSFRTAGYIRLSGNANIMRVQYTGKDGNTLTGIPASGDWSITEVANSGNAVTEWTVSNHLKATNFNFSVPTNATINGIKCEVETKYDGSGYAVVDHMRITIYYTDSINPAIAGSVAYVSDGRKAGEGAGSGTGVMVFCDEEGSWIAVDTGTVVAA